MVLTMCSVSEGSHFRLLNKDVIYITAYSELVKHRPAYHLNSTPVGCGITKCRVFMYLRHHSVSSNMIFRGVMINMMLLLEQI